MVWPGVSDYQEAVQAPRSCFRDAELQQGSPVLTRLGLPRPISGGNASVYQLRTGKREFAVRCFLREVPDLQRRYAAIDRQLQQSALRATVGFEFQPEGIRIRGRGYPILKMEWVRGVPINEHVASILDDPAALRRLGVAWCELLRDLGRAGIAHGDLQHGNVLVDKDRLVLIDYDGMFVPAFAGQPAHELGHPSFQHPQRSGSDFGPDIDRFAALVVAVALRALAENKALWAKYDNADNLLFVRDDFADPAASPLFADLRQCRDPELQAMVEALRHCCGAPIGTVPALDDAVRFGRALPAAAVAVAGAAAATTPRLPVRDGGAGRPGWLTALMGDVTEAADATAGGSSPGVAIAFSLTQSWRHERPVSVSAKTQQAMAAQGRRARWERRAVLGAVVGFAQALAYVVWPAAVFATAPACAAWLWWLRRHGPSAAAVPGLASPAVAGTAIAVAVAGHGLAVRAPSGRAEVLDLATGRRRSVLGDGSAPVDGVLAVAGGRCLLLGADGILRLHDGAGAPLSSLHHGRAQCGATSASGNVVALGSGRRVRVLAADGASRCQLAGHRAAVLAVAVARDERQIVSAAADQTVRVWSLADGRCEQVLSGGAAAPTAVAIHDQGRFVAAAFADGRVRIWDQKRQKLMHEVPVGKGALRALAFAGDGVQLLAAGDDRMIHCLDAITGRELGRVAGHAHPVMALAIAGDGSVVVSADAVGVVLAWQRRVRGSGARVVQMAGAGP